MSKEMDYGVWDPKEVLEDDEQDRVLKPTQWGVVHTDTFKALSVTRKRLPAGAYTITRDNNDGQPIFARREILSDRSFVVSEGLSSDIIKEIDDFWAKGEAFSRYGFLHSRGYLLYGGQGVGKSSIVQQIMSSIIAAGGVVFICENPTFFNLGLKVLRKTEPGRPLVCVFEDIDAIISKYGEDELLSILDGANQVNRVLNIATTNYPEKLDRRLISRPRRFDRVYKILPPSDKVRTDYLKSKLPKSENLKKWVKGTEGISFAGLAEAIISVLCLGNGFKETLSLLKDMENGHPSSQDFGKLGFSPDEDDDEDLPRNPSRPKSSVPNSKRKPVFVKSLED